ncbi:hypothetical protein LSCM1_05884 [Leishmania martiniquensis]|uniref:Kinesin motor domain-containing protein n=1 Tax=Leishmania martiniquensis TaxID=1580590 RepID=A0A836HTP1_9TRYP|nr:hypothetical protein LSCM1_05884 [Leishmania martiniquensis]
MDSASCSSQSSSVISTRYDGRSEDARSSSSEESRGTTAATARDTSASAPDGAAGYGDIYVVDAASGHHYHITAPLKDPFHSLTSVTHRALQHTVRNLLLASPDNYLTGTAAQTHRLLLLLDGAPLDDSDAVTLPSGAVVEVHRVSADLLHHSLTPSSLPRSMELASEQERQPRLPSPVRATRAHRAALQAINNHPAELKTVRPTQSTVTTTTATSLSRRLPPRRGRGASSSVSSLSSGNKVTGSGDSDSLYAFTRTSGAAAPTESRQRGAVARPSSCYASSHEGYVESSQLITASSVPSRHASTFASTPLPEEKTASSIERIPSVSAFHDKRLPARGRTGTYSTADRHECVRQSDAVVVGESPSRTHAHVWPFRPTTSLPRPSTELTSSAFSQSSSAASDEPLEHGRHALPSAPRASAAAPDSPSVTPLRSCCAVPSDEPSLRSSLPALVPAAVRNAAAPDWDRQAAPSSPLPAPSNDHAQLPAPAPLPSPPPLQLTTQATYETQRGSIAAAAAAEQRRLLTRLQQRCRALEQERKALLTARLEAVRAQKSAGRLRALREAQEEAAAAEVDAVRARLGERRDDLLRHWLRVLHAHNDMHCPMSSTLLHELEDEGDVLTLRCLSLIAGYHSQKARLQGLQQQRALKEAEVTRLRWEAHVRRCTAEEQNGCFRVVARLRPPSRRPWLPTTGLASAEATELDGGYAVRVLEGSPNAAHGSQVAEPAPCRVVEVADPPRHLLHRYTLWAAYDVAADDAGSQQRLFEDQLQPLLEHMCRTGQHVAVLAFGAVSSGKTFALVGPRAAQSPSRTRRTGGEPVSAEVPSDLGFCRSRSRSNEGDDVASAPTGITTVGVPGRRGITRCLDPAGAAMEARMRESLAEIKATKRRQRSAERHAREERDWRERAGIEEGDGLLPRAVAWLTAHLRSESPRAKASEPVVESVFFSMYEVYNDHVYDLLPNTPPSAAGTAEPDSKASSRAAWPRWNAGWLPAPHIKNSNPEHLTELQVELVPPSSYGRGAGRDAAAAISQRLQPPGQPQWRIKASEVEVRSAVEALQAIQLGLYRRRSAATLRGARSSRSHLFLRFRVEVRRPVMPAKASTTAAQSACATAVLPALVEGGNGATIGNAVACAGATGAAAKPKGYGFLRAAIATPSDKAASVKAAAAAPPPTCVAELLFTDFAGSERIELSGATGDALKEVHYIHTSLSAVSEVLLALARAHPCRDVQTEADTAARQPGKQHGGDDTRPLATAALVRRWGALVSRPGVTLSRRPPVFLQPRFTKLGSDGATRQRGGHEGRLALRRRVLALMDTCMAGEEVTQWWRRWRAASPYVPFRTCKTTQLLQSALGAPCKSLVLACVRPCSVSEVVLPASLQDRNSPRALAAARSLFAHQAPLMLSEVHATLTLAGRINDALDGDAAKRA